jgi:hypothetical protein
MGDVGIMTEDLGYYSLVRFTPDTSRGEARNVAVILLNSRGIGWVRAAPVSRVAPKARQAGMLDALLRGISARVGSGEVVGEAGLRALSESSTPTLWVTLPKPVLVVGDKTADSLYRAFVGVSSAREPRRKGELLDHLVARLVRAGAPIERNAYVGDFAVDVLVTGASAASIQVLSFCVGESRGLTIEREAGHYLFGLERHHMEAAAVVQPPVDGETTQLWKSYDRVHRWLDDAGVRTVRPADIGILSSKYGGGAQLPLSYGELGVVI